MFFIPITHSPPAAFIQGVARTVFDLVVDVNVDVNVSSFDVDVSIIGQTATFHPSMDLSVSMPLCDIVVEASDD
jgi:hypothetical protein